MAHALEMKDDKASMIYVGEMPWHQLGVALNAPPTIEEAIKLANLDWTVSLHQLSLPDGRKVDRFATVRDDNGTILGTVGAQWTPVQNRDAFNFFQPFVDSGVATIETAGVLNQGNRVWMLAKINRPDSVIVPGADDRVAKYLMLANGHDGTLAVHVSLTPIRVVCRNTLRAVVGDRSQKRRRRFRHHPDHAHQGRQRRAA